MYIAGIDTASNRAHVVVMDEDGVVISQHHLYLSATQKRWKDFDVRLYELYDRACAMFAMLPKDTTVYFERPMSHKNPDTNIKLSMAGAIFWLALKKNGFDPIWVNVVTWKIDIVGYGNARKEEIAAYVQTENPSFVVPEGKEYEDYWDAYCIAQFGVQNVLESVQELIDIVERDKDSA